MKPPTTPTKTPLAALRHYVTGAIERGETVAIVEQRPGFIVSEYRRDLKQTWYVAARPGYYRKADGTYGRDGSFQGGPEHTTKRDHAYIFQSHRAAARVANLCPQSTITAI